MLRITVARRGIAPVDHRSRRDDHGVIFDLTVRGEGRGRKPGLLRPAEAGKGLIEYRIARHDDIELNEAVVRGLVAPGSIVCEVQRDLFRCPHLEDAVAVVIDPCLQKTLIARHLSGDRGEKPLGHGRNIHAVIIVAVRVRSVPRRGIPRNDRAKAKAVTVDEVVKRIAEGAGRIRHVGAGLDIGHMHAVRPGQAGRAQLQGRVADDQAIDRLAEAHVKRSAGAGAEGTATLPRHAAIVIRDPGHGQARRVGRHGRRNTDTLIFPIDRDGFVSIEVRDVKLHTLERRVQIHDRFGILGFEHRIAAGIERRRRTHGRGAERGRGVVHGNRTAQPQAGEGDGLPQQRGRIAGPVHNGKSVAVTGRQGFHRNVRHIDGNTV